MTNDLRDVEGAFFSSAEGLAVVEDTERHAVKAVVGRIHEKEEADDADAASAA